MFRRSKPLGIAAGVTPIAIVAAAVIIYAKNEPARASAKANDPAVLEAAQPIAEADTSFGLKLFQQLVRAKPGTNVVCSPESVADALGMAYEGARGTTRTEMTKVLSLTGLGGDAQRLKSRQALQTALNNPDPEVTLQNANALWVDSRVQLLSAFSNICRTTYGAEATSLPFSANPATAAGRINDWVNRSTRGMIPTIVRPDSVAGASAVLTNAIYFKGLWSQPFEKSATDTKPFHSTASSTHSVKMMHRWKKMDYFKGDGFQAVRLPFGGKQDKTISALPRFSFYVILPDRTNGLSEVASRLSAASLKNMTSGFDPADVNLSLPRIKVSYESKPDLNGPLKALGMMSAFKPAAANFSGISSQPTAISQVIHKAVVEADEEGAKAAAATAVVLMPTAMPLERHKTVTFTVDHPFLFLIRDDATGAVLFTGAVYNPQNP